MQQNRQSRANANKAREKNKRGYVMAKAVSQRIGPYDVCVTKKRIKNMYLRVLPQGGGLAVNAPLRMSDAEISRFVLSREDWIEKQLAKQENKEKVEKDAEQLLALIGLAGWAPIENNQSS